MSDSNPISDAIKDRLKSSIFGSVVISFFSWHWRIFFYLFTGSHPADERIKFVESYYSDHSRLEFYLCPLLLSLIYLFVLPVLTDWYEHFPRKFKQRKDVLDRESELISASIAQYKVSIYSLAETMRQELLYTEQFLKNIETQLNTVPPGKFRGHVEPTIHQFRSKFDKEIAPIVTLNFGSIGTIDKKNAQIYFATNLKFLAEKIRGQKDPKG